MNYRIREYKGRILRYFKDGDMFCVSDGINLQEAMANGFGETPRKAIANYVHLSGLVPILDAYVLEDLLRIDCEI